MIFYDPSVKDHPKNGTNISINFLKASSFLKKVNVRKQHDSCSRIRVGEGSPKKKEIKQGVRSEKQAIQTNAKHVLET